MVVESEAARSMGVCASSTVARISECLSAYGLPTSVRALSACAGRSQLPSAPAVVAATLVDKKNTSSNGTPTVTRCVLVSDIGTVALSAGKHTHAVSTLLLTRLLSSDVLVSSVPSASCEQSFVVRVPGSKSVSNRTLLLAALCDRSVGIDGLLLSDDTQVCVCVSVRVLHVLVGLLAD
jgi:pentafunctional AROM polypeptide